MKNRYLKIVCFIINFSFIACGVNKMDYNTFEEEDKTISYINKKDSEDKSNPLFTSKDDKTIGLIFRGEFKDTIEVRIKDKKYFSFYKNDFPIIDSDGKVNIITDGKRNKIFETITLRKSNNNKIVILLKSAKKILKFDIERDKKLYEISYFKNHWYVTYMN